MIFGARSVSRKYDCLIVCSASLGGLEVVCGCVVVVVVVAIAIATGAAVTVTVQLVAAPHRSHSLAQVTDYAEILAHSKVYRSSCALALFLWLHLSFSSIHLRL